MGFALWLVIVLLLSEHSLCEIKTDQKAIPNSLHFYSNSFTPQTPTWRTNYYFKTIEQMFFFFFFFPILCGKWSDGYPQ